MRLLRPRRAVGTRGSWCSRKISKGSSRLPRAVRQGKSTGFWNAIPTFFKGPLTRRPSTVIGPRRRGQHPEISFNSVDLPQPLAPTNATVAPRGTSTKRPRPPASPGRSRHTRAPRRTARRPRRRSPAPRTARRFGTHVAITGKRPAATRPSGLAENVHESSIASRRRVGPGALPAGPCLLRIAEGRRSDLVAPSSAAADRDAACPVGRVPWPRPALCRHIPDSRHYEPTVRRGRQVRSREHLRHGRLRRQLERDDHLLDRALHALRVDRRGGRFFFTSSFTMFVLMASWSRFSSVASLDRGSAALMWAMAPSGP